MTARCGAGASDPDEDARRMAAALALARAAAGTTTPNPAVGCVIAKGGRLLGRGATQPGGRPHAEQVALAQARARWGAEALRGATAWVTLEPCAHHGRTPPCANALADAGIARLVCALQDPDPRVNGRGFAALRARGVAVEVGLMAAAAEAANAGFLRRVTRGLPHVTLKLAATLDGRIATSSGESRWITGPAARNRVHLMRAQADAVLVGAGTARTDDPMLDVRLPGLADRNPVRAVVDGRLSLSLMSRLARTARTQPVWLLHRSGADPQRRESLLGAGIELFEVADGDGEAAPESALRALAARGVSSVLCEGGGRLAASLLRAGLVDALAWFSAGAAIGADGMPAVGRLALPALDMAPRFALARHERLGDDVLTLWRAAG